MAGKRIDVIFSCGRKQVSVIVCLAAVLRYQSLFANTLHSDEALFASWARLIAIWSGPLLQGQPVDKPPLLFYFQALFYPLLGPVEWAARLPGLIASLLLIPVVAVLTWRIYGDELAAVLVALLTAMSPMAVQFSATGFTDPLLTFFLATALLFIVSRSTNLAGSPDKTAPLSGLLFGLAVATKHQAWLFLPLLVGSGSLVGRPRSFWVRWLAGFLPVLLFLVLWQLARPGQRGLWSIQLSNFGGLRIIWSWELWPRFRAWAALWSTILVVPVLLVGAIGASAFLRTSARGRHLTLLFVLFILAYTWIHWILAISVWDRYLLPILPLVMIVIARGLTWLRMWFVLLYRQVWTRNAGRPRLPVSSGIGLLCLLLLLAQLPSALVARQGRYPIGGTAMADNGASSVAKLLADAPYGTVLYDHWYSWQWRYHLLDSRVYVTWFPYPAALLEDLLAFGGTGSQRYLALPISEQALPILRTLSDAGIRYDLMNTGGPGQIALYRVAFNGGGS